METHRPCVGDRYRFEYPKEPHFDCVLTVTQIHKGLAFFDDHTHSNIEFLQTLTPLTNEQADDPVADDPIVVPR